MVVGELRFGFAIPLTSIWNLSRSFDLDGPSSDVGIRSSVPSDYGVRDSHSVPCAPGDPERQRVNQNCFEDDDIQRFDTGPGEMVDSRHSAFAHDRCLSRIDCGFPIHILLRSHSMVHHRHDYGH